MTHPTKALAPLMLKDNLKHMINGMGDKEKFTSDDIDSCMEKVIAVDLKQTIRVDEDLEIRAYYAGHVIGAAMFYARVGDASVLYTGDYNMTPDRHLGAAQIDRLPLDLVITESTYGTTIRDSRFAHESEFLKAVHTCVADGGKVLIPTFALGRAQEICILLEDYWERRNLKVPIYFSGGLTIQANMYSKMLISWTSQKVKEAYTNHNAFDFKHVRTFDRSLIHAPGPCVLFATPGWLNTGFSLEVFKQWATSEMNLVTLPGQCIAGTIGQKLMSGKPKKIDLDPETQIDVRCQIHKLAFSPHTDSKGIMDLMKFLSPKHVILVHGEKPKMVKLKGRIESELGIPCYHPANNETVSIPSTHYVRADASASFINTTLCPNFSFKNSASEDKCTSELQICDVRVSEGLLVMQNNNQKPNVIHQDDWSGKTDT
ncbi:cleavage and polyadenylation specificity factor subunit 3-II isoform X3 [Spinacia oleracea]|nr:cleavage and polyadenylation specificity factor subunit 3-II isoform X3 [Spinacia oleracea]